MSKDTASYYDSTRQPVMERAPAVIKTGDERDQARSQYNGNYEDKRPDKGTDITHPSAVQAPYLEIP